MIRVNNVSKMYNNECVLKNVNVMFESGKIHGLVGKNGSGKTMLMKTICGFVLPTEGFVEIDGKVIGKDIDFPPSIGMIIETPGFVPYYSGLKNLEYLASLRGMIKKSDCKRFMKVVGLDPANRKHVSKYSLGMRQRLGIAQAIMEDPDILVLDEPMNGLDKQGIEDIKKLLNGFRDNNKTILIASHSQIDIDELCNTVHEMDSGVLKAIK